MGKNKIINEIEADFQVAGFANLDVSVVTKKCQAPNVEFALEGVLNASSLATQLDEQGLLEQGRQAILDSSITFLAAELCQPKCKQFFVRR